MTEELDFSDKIRAKLYPIEESDDSSLAAERFGGKKRSALKDSAFIDPKRRSFPVMSCKDVKDAVSTWGMYKGPMSFDTFKSKLKARAKKLGCENALPAKWSEKKSDAGMKGGKADYEKVDKKELKEDTKKQKKQHYKDAIKDDKKQVKDLKKDEKIDKEKESEAKSKKEWEKIDKKELDRDTKKEKQEHEKDAVKDDQSKINKLKKGKPSTKKSVMIHDLKKDQEFDEEDKVKYKNTK